MTMTVGAEEALRPAVLAGVETFQERRMKEVTYTEYLEYRSMYRFVSLGGVRLELDVPPPRVIEPKDFELERATVWSFPKRGDWATHRYNNRFRGNWAPQVARNLLLLYSREGEVVLDPFAGSGTTLIECKLLRRFCIGVDISYEAVMLAWSRLDFEFDGLPPYANVKLYHGDARSLDMIEDESVDLVATHPPYASIIRYEKGHPGDLSGMNLPSYLNAMRDVARELYRVAKPGRVVAIMIGDMRVRKHVVPLGLMVLKVFLREGFVLKEHIIKVQHKMRGTLPWRRRRNDFLLLAHEHIFVLRKPEKNNELDELFWSSYSALELA